MGDGTRKFHSKSRNGCSQCKKRHVRCNLQSPVCSNCSRRDEICDYLLICPSPLSTLQSIQEKKEDGDKVVTFNRRRIKRRYSPVPRPRTIDNYIRLANEPILSPEVLRWFLGKLTFHPCMSCINEFALWKEVCFQADQYQYIRPILSSLCSLYEYFKGKCGSPQLYATAYQYNLQASGLFRKLSSEVSERNWLAVLTFGIGIMIFHFATADINFDPDSDFLSVFRLLRGTATIAGQVEPYFKRSQLRAVLERRRILVSSSLDEPTWQAVRRLATVQHPEGTPDEVIEAYNQASMVLMAWVRATDGYPRSWADFILFPAGVCEEFAQLLSAKQPAALLVFVYWCAIMHRTPRRWFMDGWDRRAAHGAMAAMGPEWDAMLAWPRALFAIEPPEFTVHCLKSSPPPTDAVLQDASCARVVRPIPKNWQARLSTWASAISALEASRSAF